MTSIFGFGKNDAEKLLRIARDDRSGRLGPSQPVADNPGVKFWWCLTTSAVSAASGSTLPITLGSGTVQLLQWDELNRLAQPSDSAEMTVYSVATEATDAGKLVGVMRDAFGIPYVIFELCE